MRRLNEVELAVVCGGEVEGGPDFPVFPSGMTDAEWALLEPLLPPASRVGRPRKWPLRRIVEAILYLLRGGLPWRMLPPCFPPVSSVRHWFYLWRDNGLWLTINHTLLMMAREADGREASPSAGVIDSQSVKTTESGGLCGYDAGKKIKGRKRHILTDTDGNLVHAVVHAADMGDHHRLVVQLHPVEHLGLARQIPDALLGQLRIGGVE